MLKEKLLGLISAKEVASLYGELVGKKSRTGAEDYLLSLLYVVHKQIEPTDKVLEGAVPVSKVLAKVELSDGDVGYHIKNVDRLLKAKQRVDRAADELRRARGAYRDVGRRLIAGDLNDVEMSSSVIKKMKGFIGFDKLIADRAELIVSAEGLGERIATKQKKGDSVVEDEKKLAAVRQGIKEVDEKLAELRGGSNKADGAAVAQTGGGVRQGDVHHQPQQPQQPQNQGHHQGAGSVQNPAVAMQPKSGFEQG